MPAGMNAPNDCPAEPVRLTTIEPDGSPFSPRARVTWWPSRVPTARSVLRIGRSIVSWPPWAMTSLRALDERHVEVLVELVLLTAHVAARLVVGERGTVEDRREVEPARLPVLDRAVRRRAARCGR